MKIKCIIFLFSFLFVESYSFPQSESLASSDEAQNMKATYELMDIGEQIVEKIAHQDDDLLKETNKEKISAKNGNNNVNIFSKPLENSNLFEGDIVLTPDQAENVVEEVVNQAEDGKVDISDIVSESLRRNKRKIDATMLYEWEFPILYYIEDGVNGTTVDLALSYIEKETCLKYKKQNTPIVGKSGLRFYPGTGCFSNVGRIYQNKPQDVSLGSGCDNFGIVQHEIGHTLGCVHEQSRFDRDEYLKILTENIDKNKLINFVKLDMNNALTYRTPYDYGSLMQYDFKAFGMDDKSTMIPYEQIYTATLGLRYKFSFLDLKLLNSHYCFDKCSKLITCFNGGYQDPNKCGTCKCVEGYEGPNCSDIIPETLECGESEITVTNRRRALYAKGAKNCIYHIKAPDGKKLKLTFLKVYYGPYRRGICIHDNSVEVKFLEDKTVTGAMLCAELDNVVITSKNEHVIIYHRSTDRDNLMQLSVEVA